jgi:phosphatidylserine decarboxylase
MATKQYALIAREGYGMLAVVALCAIVLQVSLGIYAAIPAWVVLALFVYMFRDPSESPPPLPLAVVSPIHGRIQRLGGAHDPWLKRDAEAFFIEMGLFDIRSIYAPVEGKIMEQWSSIPDPKPSEENPAHSSAYWIRTDENDDVVLVITRGTWGGPIKLNYSPGERIGQGRRIGYANFGCAARLYLPQESRYEVALDEKVSAGSAVVSTFVHLTRMAQPKIQADHAVLGTSMDEGPGN